MKYVSLDIETTGLDPERDKVLEFTLIADDLRDPMPLDRLPYLRGVVACTDIDAIYDEVDPTIKDWHRDLFNEIRHADKRLKDASVPWGTTNFNGIETAYYRPGSGKMEEDIVTFFQSYSPQPSGITNIAGKNVRQFDIPFLCNFLGWEIKRGPRYEKLGPVRVSHQYLDPAMLYARPGDERLPSIKECARRAGLEIPRAHSSYHDALMVVQLIRQRLGFA